MTLARSPLSTFDGTSPNARRVASAITVVEEWGSWMIGKLVRFPDATIELGWEDWQKHQPLNHTFPNTPLTYVAIWSGKVTLYEFQFGRSLVRPSPEIAEVLVEILQLFAGYAPFNLPPRAYVKGPHELSLQPLRKRQDLRKRQPVRRGRRNPKKAGVLRVRLPVLHP